MLPVVKRRWTRPATYFFVLPLYRSLHSIQDAPHSLPHTHLCNRGRTRYHSLSEQKGILNKKRAEDTASQKIFCRPVQHDVTICHSRDGRLSPLRSAARIPASPARTQILVYTGETAVGIGWYRRPVERSPQRPKHDILLAQGGGPNAHCAEHSSHPHGISSPDPPIPQKPPSSEEPGFRFRECRNDDGLVHCNFLECARTSALTRPGLNSDDNALNRGLHFLSSCPEQRQRSSGTAFWSPRGSRSPKRLWGRRWPRGQSPSPS